MRRIPIVTLLVVLALLAGGTAVSGPAAEDGPACETTGPDVIVAGIPDAFNWQSEGAIESFTIATTACNIGNELIDWINNTSQHPVIGQNMFRLRDGRFEHVGQAWLKHGFGAIQLDLCGCGCQPGGDNQHLGVGCADPYTAGRNGTQPLMGPKFEVNAATGVFPYPATNMFDVGPKEFKRIQVAVADLDPQQQGGGVYYVEAQYVHPDDATAGNKHNNASWREASVSGGGEAWTIALTGDTHQREPAIMAWASADPAVEIVVTDIPGDGRIFAGWTATSVGGDLWQYELALHNLNSDRSARSVTVPLPPGTTCTAPGFHDVDYHSGEPIDGADWTPTIDTDQVAWSTSTFAENDMANALRWGTLYNFRFIADVEPTELTEIVIGLFKPGTPETVTIPISFAGVICPADLDGSGDVGFSDILAIIGAWGPCPTPCSADLNGNGNVDFADVLAVIGAWGPCS
ncbi:MAG: hypothetical protein GY715_05570 [Planctomycetes bacterium]|nr:hypothetical protein [Planctomycetota bacterium]